MFATTTTTSAGSPRVMVGAKRRGGGCAAVNTSCAAATAPTTTNISTPSYHFSKYVKKTEAADTAASKAARPAHTRSRSMDIMTVTTSASFNILSDGVEGKHGVGKKQQQQQTSPSSPLRSRRALPSLSVGAANDDTLKGRQGIVYIQNTKMPQDGWYQRCFGCGMWTAQSVVLGQFEVFRCRCCAREFRSRAKSMSDQTTNFTPRPNRGGAATTTTTTCSSEEASQSLSLSCSSLDTATTTSTRRARGRSSPRGVTSGGGTGAGGGGGGGGGQNPVVAAARRAVRRSVRASRQRHRNDGEGAATAAAAAAATAAVGGGLPPLHRTAAAAMTGRNGQLTAGGCDGDTEMSDAAEVADSDASQHHQHQQQRPGGGGAAHSDAEVLTSLVSKLRDFLVVNMPQNGVENSLRRFESAPLPSTLRYT